jgi:Domain of unknown function (DUF5103)
MKRNLFLFLLIALSHFSNAQDTSDYFNPGFLRYENYIYKESVHTVILERNNEPLSDALIVLNSGQQLHLQFDDLKQETSNYFYRFVQCDFNWQPSELHESDYTEGFFYEQIQNWKPSFNTYQVYYHYSTVFPTEQMRITKSGNYLLIVYDNNFPEIPVITWRFRVIESLVNVTANIHRATIGEKRNSHQEIDFSVNYSDLKIANPFSDIKIALQQNGRFDNCITNLKPLFLKDQEVEYNYEEENIFNGGNEFRNFDLRSVINTTPFVKSIKTDSSTGLYLATIRREQSRSFERYSIIDDINGKYLIKIYDGRNDQTESDYVKAVFHLAYTEPRANGSFYVFGALTNWMFLPAARMVYSDVSQEYTTSLLVKQGYYNYHYVWVEDGKKTADETIIEGNHFETENDYSIIVYFRDPVTRYDRIVGFKKLNSRNIY